MSLLKKSNPAAIAVNNAGNGHGEMPGDDPSLEGLESNTKLAREAMHDDSGALTGLRSRPDYGESDSHASEMNEANEAEEEFDVPAKTAERTLLPRQTTSQSKAYEYQDISGQAMLIAENPMQQEKVTPGIIRQNQPLKPPKPAPSWVMGSEEKGTAAGYSIAVEPAIKTAGTGEMYVSSVEFSPKNAMQVEKFSFTADQSKAMVFHKLTAEDVVRQLGGPAFRVQARVVQAGDEEGMFQKLIQMLETAQPKPNVEPMIKREIAWAKQTLKKKDRVVWYLRLYRIALINSLLKSMPAKVKQAPTQASKTADTMPLQPTPQQSENLAQVPAKQVPATPKRPKAPTLKSMLKQMLEQYKKEFAAKGGDVGELPSIEDFPGIKRQLEHFYSLPVAKIQDTVLGVQSLDDLVRGFSAAEQEWQEKGKALLKPKPEDQIFKKFSNGWAWWWLPRASCDDESKAMGHCGNSPMAGRKGVSILSLREPVKYGNETLWYPHATFILHGEGDTGSLGEMKGRANKKPVPAYYPYIIELLKDPRIVAVVGGGYLPEQNFSMDDLTPQQRKEIADANPTIGLTIKDYYATYGMDAKLATRINTMLELGGTSRFDPDYGFILREWKNKPSFIEDVGDRYAKAAMNFIETGEYDQSVPDADEMTDLLDGLDSDLVSNAGRALQYNYAPEIEQWYGEPNGTNPFDPNSMEWVKQVIKDIYDIRIKPAVKAEEKRRKDEEGTAEKPLAKLYDMPVIETFYNAYISGGPDPDTTEEVLDAEIQTAIENMKDSTIESTREFPYMVVIPPEQAIELAHEEEQGKHRYRSREFMPSVTMNYQWDEWNSERAADSLMYLLKRPVKRPEMERQRQLPYEGEGMRVSKLLKNSLFSKAYRKAADGS